MPNRRYTRLTNGFSKTLRNHKAAVALYVVPCNPCRVHETLRTTPAMALGITDHIWTIGELNRRGARGTAGAEHAAGRADNASARTAPVSA